MSEQQDALMRLGRGLKASQATLKESAQYMADVASLVKEVVSRRAEVEELKGMRLNALNMMVEQHARADALEEQIYGGVFQTDRLGFGRRIV